MWRAVGALGTLFVLVLGTAKLGHAHGLLRRSQPAAGARVTRPLTDLRLEFSEALEAQFMRITITDSSGRRIDRPVLQLSESGMIVTATDPLLSQLRGPVVVTWRVVGSDGHPVEGNFRFVVDAGAVSPLDVQTASGARATTHTTVGAVDEHADHEADAGMGPARDAADATGTERWGRVEGPVAQVLRWGQYVWLLLLVGGWCATTIVLPRAGPQADEWIRPVLDRTTRLERVALVAFGATLIARVAAQASALDLQRLADWGLLLNSTAWGLGWLLAMIGVFGYAVLARLATSHAAVRGLLLTGMAVGIVTMGHALGGPTPWLAVPVGALHVLGAGVWIGSVSWLTLVALPLTFSETEARRRITQAFSPVAITGATLLGISGVLTAWRHIGSIDALVTTEYGRVLIAKLAVLTLVAVTGAYNWRVVLPVIAREGGGEKLRRSALVEVVIAAVVLAITARLVVLAPPAFATP